MDGTREIEQKLPEVDEIDDDDLRTGVMRIWMDALEQSEFESLDEIPWKWLEGQSLVRHVRDVTRVSISVADQMSRLRDIDIDKDLITAGGLLHDISYLIEYSSDEVKEWIPHPYYSMNFLRDIPRRNHIQHVVLAHTDHSNVQPKTIEAEIIYLVDRITAQSACWAEREELGLYGYY